MTMRIDDWIISIAYLSIPLFSITCSIRNHSHIAKLPRHIGHLMILVSLFLGLCGVGHVLSFIVSLQHDTALRILNGLTCAIGVATAACVFVVLPKALANESETSILLEVQQLYEESVASKKQLFTFMSFLCHEIRNPLFAITSTIEFAQDLLIVEEESDMVSVTSSSSSHARDHTHKSHHHRSSSFQSQSDLVQSEMKDSLSSINQSAALMLRLVNDVLDLSKMESGKLECEAHAFNVHELFSNLATSTRQQLHAQKQGRVALEYSMADNVPSIIISDSTRLLQIAYNHLSNASKFTEEGTISMSVSVCPMEQQLESPSSPQRIRPQEKGQGVLRIDSVHGFSFSALDYHKNTSSTQLDHSDVKNNSVVFDNETDEHDNDDDCMYDKMMLCLVFQDTGDGIPEEQLELIFQPYVQSKLSDFRKHGGTGLGLSIISKLVDIMGGHVSVTSQVGEGSKFVVYLPIQAPKDQPSSEPQPQLTLSSQSLPISEPSSCSEVQSPPSKIAAAQPASPYRKRSSDSLLEREDVSAGECSSVMPSSSSLLSSLWLNSNSISMEKPIHKDGGDKQHKHESLDDCECGRSATAMIALSQSHFISPALSLQPPAALTAMPFLLTSQFESQAQPLFKTKDISGTTSLLTLDGMASSAANRSQNKDIMSSSLTSSTSSWNGGDCSFPSLRLSRESSSEFVTADTKASTSPVAAMTPITAPVPLIQSQEHHHHHQQQSSPPRPSIVRPLHKFHFEQGTNVVLVVDDNAINRKLIGKMLSFFHLEHVTANHGQEALDILAKSRNVNPDDDAAPLFGLVLMDLSMPVMDGYQAMQAIRARQWKRAIAGQCDSHDLPIVALTANAMDEEREKAFRAGATEFATKPILRPTLHAICQRFLESTKPQLPQPTVKATTTETQPQPHPQLQLQQQEFYRV